MTKHRLKTLLGLLPIVTMLGLSSCVAYAPEYPHEHGYYYNDFGDNSHSYYNGHSEGYDNGYHNGHSDSYYHHGHHKYHNHNGFWPWDD